MSGHTDWVMTIEYMPDGTIVTGAKNRNVRVWNPQTSQSLVSFTHPDDIYSSALVSQDQVIAIGGIGTKIYFYRINGSATPLLVKFITISSQTVFSMVIYNVMYRNVNCTILYTAADYSNTNAINVTSISNIILINSYKVDAYNRDLYWVDKAGRENRINREKMKNKILK